METQTGIIISLHNDRNYGFIRGDDGVYYFFHRVGVVSPTFEELRKVTRWNSFQLRARRASPGPLGWW